MIRIIIADDQPIIRHGLRYVIALDSELKLVEEAVDGIDLIGKMEQQCCDVILMDIRMPRMDGVEATLQAKKKYPDVKVLILTTFEDEEYIFHALENGADGYLLKDSDPDDLIHAIKTIAKGGMLLHPRVTETVVSALRLNRGGMGAEESDVNPKETTENSGKRPEVLHELTSREFEIACMVMQGNTNREIASKVFVSEGTVKNHVTRILDKLGMENRKQLMVYMTKVMGN